MSRRTQLIIGASLGVAAIFFIYLYLGSIKRSVYEGMEMVKVLVAASNIPPDTSLEEKHLSTELMPRKYVHSSALFPRDLDLILGQRVGTDIKKGQVLLWSDLGVEQTGAGFASIIRENDRAISLAVDEITSVSGLIKPNDSVDILGTFVTGESYGEAKTTTITILQNVTVLAVGREFGRSRAPGAYSGGYGTVTVSVTPSEAELLTLAQEKGRITLLLRNSQNLKTEEDLPKVTMDDIIKPEKIREIQKERDIRIIKGRE
jgi:pilus assembly protein CpaB